MFTLITVALIGLTITAYVFIMSLNPSTKVENEALVIVDIPELKYGIVNKIDVKGVPLLMLKPDEKQKASILNSHVWTVNSQTYYEELGVYAYWGVSSRWGCPLEHKPPQKSQLLKWDKTAKWLGGYWSVACEDSYDYAGRAIKTYGFTYNGFNLASPNHSSVVVLQDLIPSCIPNRNSFAS